ncbi:hypothetical protein CsSME_00040072 [Camellia sinensis var. sinensis]
MVRKLPTHFLQLFSEDGFQKGIGCPNGFFSNDVLIPSLGATWISPFEFAFLGYKQDVLFIINYIVNGFFATDIILTFFVAYLDSQTYILVDNPKELQSEITDLSLYDLFHLQVHINLVCFQYLFNSAISIAQPPVDKS